MTESQIYLPFDQEESHFVNESQIEGYESPKTDVEGGFPLETMLVRTDVRTVFEMVHRIKRDRVIMDPEFQRLIVWSKKKQSKLIESCIMRLPLPVFYFAERKDGKIIVVDGLQRLTTFINFMDGKLKLTGFTKSHVLEGKTISDLPIRLQERVMDTQLTLNILDHKAPERARMEIFERVNSGTILSRQQMRNALYSGKATRWLKEVSESTQFKKATAKSFSIFTMRDREAINRFVSFYLLGVKKYVGGDMDKFLAEGIRELEHLSPINRKKLAKKFSLSMKLNFSLFGAHAFRRSLTSRNLKKTVINISLFDVISVQFARLLDRYSIENDNKLKEINQALLKKIVIETLTKKEFVESITRSTNSEKAVRIRYKLLQDALIEKFEA